MTNFGWSYPPGVTGFEREIAGDDWQDVIDRECTAEVWNSSAEDDIPCGYSGEVDASGYGYEIDWRCPACGTEYVEEPE